MSRPFTFGSQNWPGLAKLIEEAGEVGQVAGKLVMTHGRPDHWDGSNLTLRLEEELADLKAIIAFMERHCAGLYAPEIAQRAEKKLALFERWHQEQAA